MTRFFLALLLIPMAAVSAAQPPLSVTSEGRDCLRGRLIPYPTAEEAAAASSARQLYVQPLEEWRESVSDSGGRVLSADFTVPFSWIERQTFLRVESAGAPYEVWINGRRAGYSQNGFADAEYNLTKLSHEDRNTVEIRMLDRSTLSPVESFAHGDSPLRAWVISQPRIRIRDVFSRTRMGVGGRANIDVGIIVHNQTLNVKTARIYYELYSPDTVRVANGYKDVELGMYGIDTVRFAANIPDSTLWRAGRPEMYRLLLRNRIAGRDVEFYDLPAGFRSEEYSDGEFRINGRTEDMRWADVDAAEVTPAVVSRLCAEGYNALRFGAGYVSDDILSLCDSLGVYVALTAAVDSSSSGESRRIGGNPSNDPAWRETYLDRARMLVETTKRHPSVVVYRPAEGSANGICLYESYLLMSELAAGRPVFYPDGGGEWNDDSGK